MIDHHNVRSLTAGALGLIAACCTLVGCSGSDDESWRKSAAEISCEDSVKAQLKDPDSADFQGVTSVDNGDGTYKVTGQVNARNSFGGMVGFKDFVCAARDNGDEVSGRAQILG